MGELDTDQITFIFWSLRLCHGPLRSSSSLTILEDGKACDPPANNRSTLVRMKNTVVLDPWELGLSVTAVRLSSYYGTSKMNLQALPTKQIPHLRKWDSNSPKPGALSPPELILQAYLHVYPLPGHSRLTMSIFPWTRHSGSALQGPSAHSDSCL